uniref:Pol-like protein n=1 Tax=Phallusia mammillata TaxID=59560 RepID=A0A6F9DNQ9_9ASCI|nr:pol-like protein [Phallusia mammillata]
MTCGVPQGSVLGPLLFLIYINDLPSASEFETRLFADDTCLWISAYKSSTLQMSVNTELTKVDKWMRANQLSLNYTKTKYMLFSPHSASLDLQITVNGNELQKATSLNYLGVIFDERMSWADHVHFVRNKIASAAGVLSKLRHYVRSSTLRCVYFSLVHPHLLYGLLSFSF